MLLLNTVFFVMYLTKMLENRSDIFYLFAPYGIAPYENIHVALHALWAGVAARIDLNRISVL